MSVFQVHNNCAEYIQKIQKASLTPVTSQIQLLADEKVGLTCSCTFWLQFGVTAERVHV